MTNRHHPIRIVFKLYNAIRNMIVPFAIFIFNEIKGETGSQPYWVYVVTAIISILICVWSVLSWYQDTYWVEGNSLHLKSGVFSKKERTIPLNKIRSMNTEQNWMYRVLNVAKMDLQTADSNENADARIILSLKKVEPFSKLIDTKRSDNADIPKEITSRTITKKELFMMSISSKAFWVGIPIIMTVFQFILSHLSKEEKPDEESISSLVKSDVWTTIDYKQILFTALFVIAAVIIISWFFSLVVLQLKYKGWTLDRKENLLTIQYGFFEKKMAKIRTDKIQAIRIKEKMFSRLFGYSSVYLDCIGFTGENKLIIPAMRTVEIREALQILLPEFKLANDLQGLQKGAKWYAMILPSVIILIASSVGAYFMPLMWLLLMAIPLSCALLWYQHRHARWGIQGNQLVIVKGKFTKTSVYVLRRAIESVTFGSNKIQKSLAMGELGIDIDSPAKRTEYQLLGISSEDYVRIQHWYKNK